MQGQDTQEKKSSLNILVAEGDPFQRITFIDLLELCNYNVCACENGIQARDELLKIDNDFDLILLDLMISGINGLELLKQIKQVERLKETPVIIMSCEAQNLVVGACIAAGAQNYLVKPVSYKKLLTLQEYARNSPIPKAAPTISALKKQGTSLNILVAEGDPFQSIIHLKEKKGINFVDLLELCNYNVCACENGIQARDELLKTENDFDLILQIQ